MKPQTILYAAVLSFGLLVCLSSLHSFSRAPFTSLQEAADVPSSCQIPVAVKPLDEKATISPYENVPSASPQLSGLKAQVDMRSLWLAAKPTADAGTLVAESVPVKIAPYPLVQIAAMATVTFTLTDDKISPDSFPLADGESNGLWSELSSLPISSIAVSNFSLTATISSSAMGCLFDTSAIADVIGTSNVALTISPWSSDNTIRLNVAVDADLKSPLIEPIASALGINSLALSGSIAGDGSFTLQADTSVSGRALGLAAKASASFTLQSKAGKKSIAATLSSSFCSDPDNAATCWKKPLVFSLDSADDALVLAAKFGGCIGGLGDIVGASDFDIPICKVAMRGNVELNPTKVKDFSFSAVLKLSDSFLGDVFAAPDVNVRGVISNVAKGGQKAKWAFSLTASTKLEFPSWMPFKLQSTQVTFKSKALPAKGWTISGTSQGSLSFGFGSPLSAQFGFFIDIDKSTAKFSIAHRGSWTKPLGLDVDIPIKDLKAEISIARTTTKGAKGGKAWKVTGTKFSGSVSKSAKCFKWLADALKLPGLNDPDGTWDFSMVPFKMGASADEVSSEVAKWRSVFPNMAFQGKALKAGGRSSEPIFGFDFDLAAIKFPSWLPFKLDDDSPCRLYVAVTKAPGIVVGLNCPLQLNVPGVGSLGPVFSTSIAWDSANPAALALAGSPKNGKILDVFGMKGINIDQLSVTTVIQVGVTPKLKLSGAIEFDGAMSGLSKVLGSVSVPVSISIAPDVVEFSAGVMMKFSPSYPIVAGELMLHIRNKLMPPSLTIGGSVAIKFKSGPDPALYPKFGAEVNYVVTTTDLHIKAFMEGEWNNAFGIKGFSIADASLELGVNLAQAAATGGVGAISRFGVQGKFVLGKKWILVKLLASTTSPTENCVIGQMNEPITIIDVIGFAIKLIAKGSGRKMNAPSFQLPFVIRDVTVAASASDVQVADKFFPKGFTLAGAAQIFGTTAANVSFSVSVNGVKGFIKFAPIRFGNAFVLAAAEDKQNIGPYAEMDISFLPTPKAAITASAYLKAFGGYGFFKLDVSFTTFRFVGTINKIFGLPFYAYLEYESVISNSGMRFRCKGEFKNSLQETINNAVEGFVKEQKAAADRAIAPVQTRINDAKRSVQRARDGLQRYVDAVNRAHASVSRAQGDVNNLQHRANSICHIRHCSNVCVPGLRWDGCAWSMRFCWPCWRCWTRCSNKCMGGFKTTSCMFQAPNIGCIAANTACHALKAGAYVAVRVGNGVLEVAKGALRAAEHARHIAAGPLHIAEGVLTAANGALTGIVALYKGILSAAQLLIRFGMGGLLSITSVSWEVNMDTAFNSNARRTFSVRVVGKIASRINFDLRLDLDLSSPAAFARSVAKTVMDNIKRGLSLLDIATDHSTQLPIVDEVLHAALRSCAADDTACIEAFARTQSLFDSSAHSLASWRQDELAVEADGRVVDDAHSRIASLLEAGAEATDALVAAEIERAVGAGGSVEALVEVAGKALSNAAKMEETLEKGLMEAFENLPADQKKQLGAQLKSAAPELKSQISALILSIKNSTTDNTQLRSDAIACVRGMIAEAFTSADEFAYKSRKCVASLDKEAQRAGLNGTKATIAHEAAAAKKVATTVANDDAAKIGKMTKALEAKFGRNPDFDAMTPAQKKEATALMESTEAAIRTDVKVAVNAYNGDMAKSVKKSLERAATHVELQRGDAQELTELLLRQGNALPATYVNARFVGAHGAALATDAEFKAAAAEIVHSRGLEGRVVSLHELVDKLSETEIDDRSDGEVASYGFGALEEVEEDLRRSQLLAPRAEVARVEAKLSSSAWATNADGSLDASQVVGLAVTSEAEL